MMKLNVAVLALAAIAGPAVAQDGPVVVWFTEPPTEVSDQLEILCADRNATVIEQDDRHVLCQREVSGARGVLGQALLGGSSATPPQLMVRFSILRDGKASRVQASQYVELQMAGGQNRRTDLKDRKQRIQLEETLITAGGHNAPPDELAAP